ncbi:hypothetical protein C8A01DRAFT_20610 [Parachaetomium inaequale]|uniref:C2H2-type domain-containing protein n=1 Tax=Parachaetomium inaequale TaxID=2588326 RepID=A0AAN6SM19_9PEZI|nr:hypothetical protein C8A01DRAFT_20610 [Parachaetomium inaequale]
MNLTSSPMCNIDPDSGANVNFGFNSLQAEGTEASVRPSSYPSSSFGPYIPTSGYSTPLPAPSHSGLPSSISFDFGSSFASLASVVPFRLILAPSTTFTYHPMAPKTDNASNQGRHDLSIQALGSYGAQLTSSQTMDCKLLANQPSPNSHLLTPSVITDLDDLSDNAAHQMYPDVPINFNQQVPTTLVGTVDRAMTTPFILPSTERDQVLIGEARHGTGLQQQVQRCSPSNSRSRIKRKKNRRAVVAGDSSFALDNVVKPAAAFKCPIKGCPKLYHRNEHVKRHIKTAHDRSTFPCKFCNHVANRSDNYMAHLKLHTKPRLKSGGSQPRVAFSEDAVLEFKTENESRRRGKEKLSKPL